MKKEVLRLIVKLTEIKIFCGYDITDTLTTFKSTPYKSFDESKLKELINWHINEYQLDNYEPETA